MYALHVVGDGEARGGGRGGCARRSWQWYQRAKERGRGGGGGGGAERAKDGRFVGGTTPDQPAIGGGCSPFAGWPSS